ncbi:MAG: HD domain-containing protein [Lachnospiraceae bacterium]|nr:HD domain-containing protein [Lachnospiraceae bacterium]
MLRYSEELRKLFNRSGAYPEDIEDAIDHGTVVANLAYMISKELGFDEEFCSEMTKAGMLHDIGKLELGAYLYGRRKDSLKIEELKYTRMHPTLGYNMLKNGADCSDLVLETVYHHHENYDGSGYPDNIAQEDIPLGARILRVCDVYSALVSERPYRAAFDQNTAIDLMIDEVKNFDMKVFLAFMKVVHSDEYEELGKFIAEVNEKKKAAIQPA